MVKNTIVKVAIAVLLMISSTQAYSRFCNGIWKPYLGTTWMWQLSTVPTTAQIDSYNVQAIDLDMFTTPVSIIDYIHSKGKAVICYIDTQYEPGRPDSGNFTSAVLGSPIDGWPGQKWVDIRSPIVSAIMVGRAKIAASKGCDAIEWDDVDGYANENGFNLQYSDQITFNKYLATLTHSLGMSVGLKNDLDQVADLVSSFDWALNEQCYQYKECSALQPFLTAKKAVFGTEYQGSASTFCPAQNKAGFSWLLSDLDLDGKGTTQCCSFNSPACTKAAYQCITANGTNIAPHDESENLPSSSSSLFSPAVLVAALVASFLAVIF